jgi:hypothetical protein
MAKIEKHADFIETLHTMITKEGTAGIVTGVPGKDTNPSSISKETEHINKNEEGHPEKNPQEFKQEKATHPSDPTKKHAEEGTPTDSETKEAAAKVVDTTPAKPATKDSSTKVEQKVADAAPNEKLAELGKQLLDAINVMNKTGTAGVVSGVPGKDTNPSSISKSTDHVNKNEEGHPEKNPQEFKQEKATHPSDPTKTHSKKAEEEALELDKEASFELGRQFARSFLSSNSIAENNIYKEAGRKDFEALIAQASAELDAEGKKTHHDVVFQGVKKPSVKTEEAVKVAEVNEYLTKQAEEEMQVKQAEEAGAQAFYSLLKEAQEQEQVDQIKLAFEQRINGLVNEKNAAEQIATALSNKLAEQTATLEKKAADDQLDAKFAQWGGRVVEEVISRLKHEPAN